MPRPVQHIARIITAAALASSSGALLADAPRDIQTNQRLWLDGFDISATDTGNGGGTRPANGTQVTQWKDKSPNGYIAGDATSYGANPRTYPTYSAGSGISFDGVKDVLEIAGNIFGTTSVTASEVVIVASTRSIAALPILFSSGAIGTSGTNRYMGTVPWNDGNIYWDHGNTTGGRAAASWSGTGSVLGQSYSYSFRSSSGGTIIGRNNATLASVGTTATYSPTSTHYFELASGESDYRRHHDGVISEMLVYSRVLKVAERNILHEYLGAKYGNSAFAGSTSRFSNAPGFNYHVGGIGQETDGSLTSGTSAGLTIANSTFLSNGRYLLAGTDSLNPATGTTTADAPTGYTRRSSRVWYIQRTSSGGAPGAVNMTFNLTQMGVSPASGATLALATRSGTTGQFATIATATYNGSGTVTFSVSNPSTAYYAVGAPISGTPAISATLGSQVVSDPVNASNFKAIPGALLKTNAVVTNSSDGSVDANSTQLTFAIPTGMKLYLGDIGTVGGGPVNLTQGATNSGLTYTYTSLASTTDSLDFSNNSGASWTYTPTPDAQQGDSAVTNIRLRPGGTFTGGA